MNESVIGESNICALWVKFVSFVSRVLRQTILTNSFSTAKKQQQQFVSE